MPSVEHQGREHCSHGIVVCYLHLCPRVPAASAQGKQLACMIMLLPCFTIHHQGLLIRDDLGWSYYTMEGFSVFSPFIIIPLLVYSRNNAVGFRVPQ